MNTSIDRPHCKACGRSDGETVYLANQNEGYTECCNKALAYDCSDPSWCTHLQDDEEASR